MINYNTNMPNDILSLLQGYYPRAFPAREDPLVSDLVSLNNGWESDVYAFIIEWGPAGLRQREDLILRVYPGGDAYTKSGDEFRNLSILRRAGYPVPRVDCLERDNSPFERPFLIMERIHGRPMWDTMFHSPPEEAEQRLRQFCGLFTRLHAIDWRPFVPNPAEFEPGGPYAVVDRQIERWGGFIKALPMPGMQAGWDWLVEHQHDVPSPVASLVHWDFHPHNILVCDGDEAVSVTGGEADGSAYVIDWTGLDLTDYRFDLAWTLLLINAYVSGEWRERILREYERQVGHEIEGMAFFDAAACLRRLVSVIGSLALGADKMGMRPGAEEIMRKQAAQLRVVYTQFQTITGLAIAEVESFLTGAGV